MAQLKADLYGEFVICILCLTTKKKMNTIVHYNVKSIGHFHIPSAGFIKPSCRSVDIQPDAPETKHIPNEDNYTRKKQTNIS